MRTAHTAVCPTGISGPYVTKGIFHTGLNRLGIRNKLEIHNIPILFIEARKEVGGASIVRAWTYGWQKSNKLSFIAIFFSIYRLSTIARSDFRVSDFFEK